MALRATIYKANLHVANQDLHHYASHSVVLAKHPSETTERMMVRLVAFALNAKEDLVFTKGLSEVDEPDIWLKDLTGSIQLWIDVGQPDDRRILKACGRADQVKVYCYARQVTKLWWEPISNKLERAKNLTVIAFPSEQTKALDALVASSMDINVNVQDGSIFVSSNQGEVTIDPLLLRPDR